MLHPSFDIKQQDFDRVNFGGTNLYIDFGAGHLAMAVMLSTSGRFVGLEYYHLKNNIRQDDLREMLSSHPLLSKSFNRVLVSFNTKESVLLPEKMYHDQYKERVLATIHGDLNTGIVLSESTDVSELKNIYRVPGFYKEKLQGFFLRAPTGMYTQQL